MGHPWEAGSHEENWSGYFIAGTTVLRNKLGIASVEVLRDAENDLVEARLIELRESPRLLGERTYDLTLLQAIHRHLFQDVRMGRASTNRRDREGRVRSTGDLERMEKMFAKIIDSEPAYEF